MIALDRAFLTSGLVIAGTRKSGTRTRLPDPRPVRFQSCGQLIAECDRPPVQQRDPAAPLPVLGPRAALRSGSACHRMTLGSAGLVPKACGSSALPAVTMGYHWLRVRLPGISNDR